MDMQKKQKQNKTVVTFVINTLQIQHNKPQYVVLDKICIIAIITVLIILLTQHQTLWVAFLFN